MTRRMVERHVWQDALDEITSFTKTPQGRSIYNRRKETIERSFAEAKVNHGLRFARMLGIRNLREQCLALVDKVVIQQDGHMEFCFRNGMLGIRNMREQCFLTAAIQNIKRMVSSFFLALFCLSLQQNPAFADWRGLSMV